MKEKQPYEKPKMTFIENQPERRKNLKKRKNCTSTFYKLAV